ncbi:MAG: excinuclease ABC subunit UvrA [Oligoflexales bacterium]|nr:excinuclease ABC subunit UvrA [Oligoflexales bacterium]
MEQPGAGNWKPHITIKGAHENNLQHCDLKIHRGSITVVTGVSGSGKSSLVFDTILAEAHRRFFYTLSHYSRQFLNMGTKPKVVQIDGLSPAIGLAQNETQPSKRASVGTLSDLAELLGVLFANYGERFCPEHNLPTTAQTLDDIAETILASFEGKMLAVVAPLVEGKKGHFKKKLEGLAEQGFLRILLNGKTCTLSPIPDLNREEKHTIKLIVDYVRVTAKNLGRLKRSVETALEHSKGFVECFDSDKKGNLGKSIAGRYALSGGCPVCRYSWPKLDARYFSANSLGRCPACNGLGMIQDDTSEESEQSRVCHECDGTGIHEVYRHIRLGGKSIQELHNLDLRQLKHFCYELENTSLKSNPAFMRVLEEVLAKLKQLGGIGLHYLHMARRIHTLSGGELQRLKLAGVLSQHLRGVLYVLDEPSQGLHPQELTSLLKVLQDLKKNGNTILMVDHDDFMIKNSDWIVDMGPGGGVNGGKVLAQFTPLEANKYASESKTAGFISAPKPLGLDTGSEQKIDESRFISILGAKKYHLSIPELRFLKGGLNVVTGVSGSGKSTLVQQIFYRACCKQLLDGEGGFEPEGEEAHYKRIVGLDDIKKVTLIDRKPLSKTRTSMPATYLDVFTYIRQIFEKLPEAQIMGLKSRDFSLQVKGGRCEECKGQGEITLSMKFLADARVQCPSCQGARYQPQILNIQYMGYSLADILNLTIEEALNVFKHHPKVTKRLQAAKDLGLAYLRLGQTSLSLSGGEAQRLKLVPFFSKKAENGTVLILDEPTRGLHTSDIELLTKALLSFVSSGGTIILIEHCHELIAKADWVVDLGPGSGELGGKLVFEGPIRSLLKSKVSKTAEFLRQWSQPS